MKNVFINQAVKPLPSGRGGCQHNVQFNWIKGHAGHIENERCDSLASAAICMKNLPFDEYSID